MLVNHILRQLFEKTDLPAVIEDLERTKAHVRRRKAHEHGRRLNPFFSKDLFVAPH